MNTRRNTDRRGFLKTLGLASTMTAVASWTQPHGTAVAADSSGGDGLPVQLGLASYTTRKFSLEETVAMCQRLELKHVCLKSFHLPLDATDDQITAAAKLVRNADLDLYAGGVISMKRPEDVDNAFQYAKAAGMRRIVGVPAPEVLPLVDEKVKQFDIEVAIHNHGPGDKVYPTPASAYEKIQDLDARIGLCMDIGHTLRIGADPVVDAKRFADRLLDVHLKDVSAAAPQGKTVEIGRGVIDIPAFLRTLVDIGYTRIAAFEYEKDADDPLPGLAESVGYVRGVLAAV
jgi:sugar phosphate isomerase/epimerase